MSNFYFGEREFGLKPRIEDEIDVKVWGGLVVLINKCIDEQYFAEEFSERCPDNNNHICGTDQSGMKLDILSSFPNIKWPLDGLDKPYTLTILELLEFCHEKIARPSEYEYHKYFQHNHLRFEREEGQAEFRNKVNRIFERNGITFELQENGQITRLAPPIVSDILNNAIFQTNDKELDLLLETARIKYLNPDFKVRLEALEKLWDAWERIKTLDDPSNKKKSVEMLLRKASDEEKMKEVLKNDAEALTYIGNNFMIRHTEVGKTPITSSVHVDYLFHRMFSLIYLLLGNRIEKKPVLTTKEEIGEFGSVDEIQF